MTNHAPAPAPAAFDAWHDDASRHAFTHGLALRDVCDASDAEEAFNDGTAPAAFVDALVASMDD